MVFRQRVCGASCVERDKAVGVTVNVGVNQYPPPLQGAAESGNKIKHCDP